jgi:hypothetical protein
MSWINGGSSGMNDGDKLSTDGAGVSLDVYYPPFSYFNPVTGKPLEVTQLNTKAMAETTVLNCDSEPAKAAKATLTVFAPGCTARYYACACLDIHRQMPRVGHLGINWRPHVHVGA